MKRAAGHLKPFEPPSADAHEIHFLTGDRFWYQTVFCAHSLNLHLKRVLQLVVYDDGTLRTEQAKIIESVFPGVKIMSAADTNTRVNFFLPEEKFPVLRSLRLSYPHIKKLIDLHVGSKGWKLVLDSDMLFFSAPSCLLEWLEAGDNRSPIHMVDVVSSYGYDMRAMEEICGHEIRPCLNVGICGLRSDAIDWSVVEAWCTQLIERFGRHYLLEQAIVAMLAAGRAVQLTPKESYVVMPPLHETLRPTAILHHYVASSKYDYQTIGWRRHFAGNAIRSQTESKFCV